MINNDISRNALKRMIHLEISCCKVRESRILRRNFLSSAGVCGNDCNHDPFAFSKRSDRLLYLIYTHQYLFERDFQYERVGLRNSR